VQIAGTLGHLVVNPSGITLKEPDTVCTSIIGGCRDDAAKPAVLTF
jgi:hypothetical protein